MPGSNMAAQQQSSSAKRELNTTAQSLAAPGKQRQRKKSKVQKVSGSTGSSARNTKRLPSPGQSTLAAGQLQAATTPRLAVELSPTPTQSSPLAVTASASLLAADGTAGPVYQTSPTSTSNINPSPGMMSLASTQDHPQHLATANSAMSAFPGSSAAPDQVELTLPQRLDIRDVTSAAAAHTPNRTDAFLRGPTICDSHQSGGLLSTQALSSTAHMDMNAWNTSVESLKPGLQQPIGICHLTSAATPTMGMPSWGAGGPQPDSPRPHLPLTTLNRPTGAAASTVGMPSWAAGRPQPDSSRPHLPLPTPNHPSGAAASTVGMPSWAAGGPQPDSPRPHLPLPTPNHPSHAAASSVGIPSWAAGGPRPDSPRPHLPLPTPNCPTSAAASTMGMLSWAAGGPQPDSPRPPSTASLPLAPTLQVAAALPDPPRLILPEALQAIFANTSNASRSASPNKRVVDGLDRQEKQLPIPHIREGSTTAHPSVLPLNRVGTALVTHCARTAAPSASAQPEINLHQSTNARLANSMAPRSVRLARPTASLSSSMPPDCGGAGSSTNTRAGLSELVDLGRQLVDMGTQILHGSSMSIGPPIGLHCKAKCFPW